MNDAFLLDFDVVSQYIYVKFLVGRRFISLTAGEKAVPRAIYEDAVRADEHMPPECMMQSGDRVVSRRFHQDIDAANEGSVRADNVIICSRGNSVKIYLLSEHGPQTIDGHGLSAT